MVDRVDQSKRLRWLQSKLKSRHRVTTYLKADEYRFLSDYCEEHEVVPGFVLATAVRRWMKEHYRRVDLERLEYGVRAAKMGDWDALRQCVKDGIVKPSEADILVYGNKKPQRVVDAIRHFRERRKADGYTPFEVEMAASAVEDALAAIGGVEVDDE